MSEDIQKIAEGLTKAQRASMRAVLHQKPGGQIVPAEPSVRKALQRRGLVETAYGFITPLGQQVRAYLQGNPS